MKTALTIGTFDIPHIGHAAFLARCAALADSLAVGVNSDAFVAAYKGAAPLFSQRERMDAIGELGYDVHLNDSPGRDLILRLQPEVLVIGDDWMPGRKDYLAQIDMDADDFRAIGLALAFVPRTPGISTTMIRERLR